MGAGHHQHQAVVAVGDDFELFGVHRASHDANVSVAFGDRMDDVMAHALAQVDVDVRVGLQVTAQHRGQKLTQRRGVGKNAQVALDAFGVLLHVAAHVLDLAQHNVGMLDKSLSRRRQGHALAAAVKQLGTDALFEVFDARAGGCQRNVGVLCPLGEAAEFRHPDDEA